MQRDVFSLTGLNSVPNTRETRGSSPEINTPPLVLLYRSAWFVKPVVVYVLADSTHGFTTAIYQDVVIHILLNPQPQLTQHLI